MAAQTDLKMIAVTIQAPAYNLGPAITPMQQEGPAMNVISHIEFQLPCLDMKQASCRYWVGAQSAYGTHADLTETEGGT